MKNQISADDIRNNTFFWYSYFSCFNGYDAKNEINIEEALEVLKIDESELDKWNNKFFFYNQLKENTRFIGERLNNYNLRY